LAVEVKLPSGEIAVISEQDKDRVSSHKWYVAKKNNGKKYIYAFTQNSEGKKTFLYLHRLILALQPSDGMIADHINGDTFDNRRENLRVATPAQNNWNSKKKGGSNKYKGISLIKETGMWDVRINANNRRYYLGHYRTEEEAALAYNKAAYELHGEFARVNEVAR
jgi:hypothetical protein